MPTGKLKAILYLRLSVDEEEGQAQSIEAQRFEARRYAEANSIEIIEECVDAGVSGQLQSRPGFDRMLALACAKPSPVSIVLFYKLDRFARNQRVFHNACHQLSLAGVDLISVSEQFGRGRNARLGMSVSAIMAEQQAIAASVHTAKSRRENARQGYWNGGPVPFGYETYVAATVGKKSRMRLQIVEEEATDIRQIYDWAGQGHGGRWIVKTLHERGKLLRGAKFTNGNVAGILAREHYVGRYYDRTCDDEGKKPEREDWIEIACPMIVTAAQAEAVAALRASRNPRRTPPHVSAGTTLLAGVAKCGAESCGCAMTIRTGKGGRYAYYTCANRVNGSSRCSTPSVRREALDDLVLTAIEKRLLQPERLQSVLSQMLSLSDSQRKEREAALSRERAEQTRARTAIDNLLGALEAGVINARDPSFAQRIAVNKERLAATSSRILTLETQLAKTRRRITPSTIDRFGVMLSQKLRAEDRTLRNHYMKRLVSSVTVSSDQVVIAGLKAALENGLARLAAGHADKVPSFDREWCRLQDSNL